MELLNVDIVAAVTKSCIVAIGAVAARSALQHGIVGQGDVPCILRHVPHQREGVYILPKLPMIIPKLCFHGEFLPFSDLQGIAAVESQ